VLIGWIVYCNTDPRSGAYVDINRAILAQVCVGVGGSRLPGVGVGVGVGAGAGAGAGAGVGRRLGGDRRRGAAAP
jgi:hypothetical protein